MISLHCASLKPDTIRTLMLVKQRLKLARSAVEELLGDSDDSMLIVTNTTVVIVARCRNVLIVKLYLYILYIPFDGCK
jgi:hypothetical protein